MSRSSPYQTYAERFMIHSSLPRQLVRGITNRYFPQMRQKWSLLTWDGPLAPRAAPDEPGGFFELHDEKFPDPYKYLEEKHDRRSMAWLKLERRHHKQYDDRFDLQGGKHRIWQELDQRLLITTREGGFDKGEERIGDFLYYTRSKTGDDVVFMRKRPGQSDALGDELIDTEELMRQFGYATCTIGTIRVSADGQYLAYTVSVEGGDRYLCHVKSIDHGGMFHVIRSTNIVNIEFGSGNSFYYTECNDLNRPFRIMMMDLRPGILPEPIEIYRDDDERYFVDVRKTKDGKFMIISSDSKERGNVLVLPASYPVVPAELLPLYPEPVRPIEIAGKEAWGWLEHHGGCFVMVTSRDDSPNFKIVYAREEEVLFGGKEFTAWKPLLDHDPGCQIQDLDIFQSHLVVFENAFEFERQQQLRIIDLTKGVEKADRDRKNHMILHFPELTQITPGLNKNFVQDSFNFMYSSIIQPVRECVYDFGTKLTPAAARGQPPGSLYSQRQHESLSPWDYMWPYHTFRDTYASHDGTQVPITICQRRDLFVEEVTEWEPMSNTARFCLLYVYGSYGETPALHFQPLPYMWMLRRRWTCAFAHIRGGGERGPEWAAAGKGQNKMNGVLDFVHACKYLCDQGFTAPSRLVVVGNSAGAVPIAAAMNMYGRDLFNLALLRSPFLDIIGTMMNPELPLSLSEREDWGDPLNSKSDLDYLRTYDPYHNIRDDIDYPSMVISAAMDDDRVPAWNAMKYAARMREQRRKRNVDPLRWAMHTRFPQSGGHYHFNEVQQICEELIMTINHLSLPSTYFKELDMDAMQQMHNGFKMGMMDHDDQQQTFLKWENWEREKIEYVQKLHTQEYEPNFRVLRARKQPFFWTATHDDGSLREKAEKMAEEGVPPPPEFSKPERNNI